MLRSANAPEQFPPAGPGRARPQRDTAPRTRPRGHARQRSTHVALREGKHDPPRCAATSSRRRGTSRVSQRHNGERRDTGGHGRSWALTGAHRRAPPARATTTEFFLFSGSRKGEPLPVTVRDPK